MAKTIKFVTFSIILGLFNSFFHKYCIIYLNNKQFWKHNNYNISSIQKFDIILFIIILKIFLGESIVLLPHLNKCHYDIFHTY